MADSIASHHQAITVEIDGELHIISIIDIRKLSAGAQFLGNRDKLIRVLAKAIKDLVDESR